MSILRSAREALGLTREELARRARTSTSTVARIELNGHLPNSGTIRRLADVLNLSADELIDADAAANKTPALAETGDHS